jgi:hypothetical protein
VEGVVVPEWREAIDADGGVSELILGKNKSNK